jgi:hypothetical protein
VSHTIPSLICCAANNKGINASNRVDFFESEIVLTPMNVSMVPAAKLAEGEKHIRFSFLLIVNIMNCFFQQDKKKCVDIGKNYNTVTINLNEINIFNVLDRKDIR